MVAFAGLDDDSLVRLRSAIPSAFFVVGADGDATSSPWEPGVVHPDDEPHLVLSWRRARAAGEPFRCRARLRGSAGGYARSEIRGVPLRTAAGAVVGWVANRVSLHTESLTRAPRIVELLGAICKTASDLIYVKDVEGRYLYVNPTCAGVLGASAEEITGTTDARWFPADLAELLGAEERDVIARRAPSRSDHEIVVQGAPRLYSIARDTFLDDDGNLGGIVGIARDVTDVRRELAAVREERDMFATIADVVPGAFASFRVRPDGTREVPFATFAVTDIFGVTPDELERDPTIPDRLTHPDDRARVAEALARSARDLSACRCESRVDHPTRGEIWVELVSGPIREPDGSTLWHGFLLDVTERKRVERELHAMADRLRASEATLRSVVESVRASEERYRRLIDLLPDAVFVHVNQRLTYCNEAFVRLMSARSREELMGVTPHQVVHPDHHELLGKRLATMRDQRQAVPPVELSVVALDGVRRVVSVVAAPIPSPNDELAIVVVLHDLTERKKLEEQFRQAHKMEAFGQLAGGVAHDFNNLLTVILGECSLLLTTLPPGAPEATAIAEIQKAGDRAAGLTRQLLAFSRRTVLEPKVLDLNVTVRETDKLLRRIIGEDIQLETSLQPALSRVHVDPGQLVQVLMNLVVNARDAMPRGGRLEIATANVTLDAAKAESIGLRGGAFVKLSVRDAGVGMTSDVRARIFQPFFTTKAVGEGTGLGLAVVHGIVTQSGGAIEIHSEVGRGTLCEIYLPASRSASSPSVSAVAATSSQSSGAILVVEDDAALQRLARRILSMNGYTVHVADNGVAALEMLEKGQVTVDLVVTDVVMPTMGGGELGERLRGLFPDLKVLYVSGYTTDMLVRRGLQSEEVEFLSKPYTPSSLGAAVARILQKT